MVARGVRACAMCLFICDTIRLHETFHALGRRTMHINDVLARCILVYGRDRRAIWTYRMTDGLSSSGMYHKLCAPLVGTKHDENIIVRMCPSCFVINCTFYMCFICKMKYKCRSLEKDYETALCMYTCMFICMFINLKADEPKKCSPPKNVGFSKYSMMILITYWPCVSYDCYLN